MHEFSVFEQERCDGGVRTGISLDGELCWHNFQEGDAEEDPALRWYIDVRGEGDAVADDPVELHRWLRSDDVSALIREALLELAARVVVGIDQGSWPLQHEVANAPAGVRILLVTSATRRMESLSISEVIRRFAQDWPGMLDALELTALPA
jgi:hypothetical protein